MVRIDRIWTGTYVPMMITLGDQTETIGLSAAEWRAPMDVVCARLRTAIEAAHPEPTWSMTADPATGAVTLTCSQTFSTTIHPGLAALWGWASTYYNDVTEVTTEGTPTWTIAGVRMRIGLPVAWWMRAVVGDRVPVVWDGPILGWDLEMAICRWSDAPPFDPARVPVAISQGDPDPWRLSHREGWIAVRPLAEQTQRVPVGSSADWGKISYRAVWLDGVVEA